MTLKASDPGCSDPGVIIKLVATPPLRESLVIL